MATRITGSPPWFANLAGLLDPAQQMLDEFATAFASTAVDLPPDVYWTAFHCYVLDELMTMVFAGPVDETWLRQAAWVSYATGFWCTRSWRGVWLPLDESFSLRTTADSVAGMAAELHSKLSALKAGDDAALERLDGVLRAATFHGAVFGTAYNTSYLIVVGEPSPLGQRPAHLTIAPGFVRADADSFLQLEYESRLPAYLAKSRDRYATAEADGGDAFRAVLDGGAGATSLQPLWKDGFNLEPQNWGSDFITAMIQEYYDPFVHWSGLYNFGLEAIARSAIIALAQNDADTALQALAGNMIFDGSWGSIQLGVLDGAVTLPTVANG